MTNAEPHTCRRCGNTFYHHFFKTICPECHVSDDANAYMPTEAEIAEECRKIREARLAEKAAVVGAWDERPSNIRCYGKRVSGRTGSGTMTNRPRPL